MSNKTTPSKILIGNISSETTEPLIRDLFSRTSGLIVTVSIPLDAKTNRHRGYAFVEMSSLADAEQAVSDLHGTTIDGRAVSLSVVEAPAKRKWYQGKAR